MKRAIPIAILIAIDIILFLLVNYVALPAFNLSDGGFIGLIIVTLFVWILETLPFQDGDGVTPLQGIFSFAIGGILIVWIVGAIANSPLVKAKTYSSLLTVENADADSAIPTTDDTNAIPLMDTASAEKLGDREIGGLSDVVSQYDVGSYTQIDYQGRPVKIAPLKYSSYWKWTKNRDSGIPGYILVDPVTMDAQYVKLDKGMKYTPSAWFEDNLQRRIRKKFPTALFDGTHFEIDEDGNPYFISTVYERNGVFGAKVVKGCIISDPCSGEMKYYSSDDIPKWVDLVYHGNLLCRQYNYFAQLQNGFWNSQFGQKGCKQTTNDYGYIAKDGDIWIYTGVTSVNSDSSNLGFLIANERTGEARFVSCAGADEHSAMKSAEGEVQQYGYHASFPSLININGVPTYVMVLKDNSGLVKMYACVNVSQYNKVATATSQSECIQKYSQLIKSGGSSSGADDEWVKKTITVRDIAQIDQGGDTYIYIDDTDGGIYCAKYADVIGMIHVREGNQVTIETDGSTFRLS